MKLLIQRVQKASVEVEGKVVGSIGRGVLVFLGITHGDGVEKCVWMANKLAHLRLFEDAEGKINRSVVEEKGAALIVSQFTLYGDCSEGRRPSFAHAARSELAKPLYEQFIDEVKKAGIPVQTGIFGAEMKVSLINDGPVTLIVER